MGVDLILAVEKPRDLPMPPIAFGLLIFGFFVVLMIGLLMFGKGRPHS